MQVLQRVIRADYTFPPKIPISEEVQGPAEEDPGGGPHEAPDCAGGPAAPLVSKLPKPVLSLNLKGVLHDQCCRYEDICALCELSTLSARYKPLVPYACPPLLSFRFSCLSAAAL